MWVDELEEIRYSPYTPSDLDFGLTYHEDFEAGKPTKVGDWIGCREEFHHENRGVKRFYFHHSLPEGRGRSIAVFLDKVEDRLGLPEHQRTRIGPTNKRKTVWVEASEWWRHDAMRRSLFTALLKQSVDYRISLDNFDEALYCGIYTCDTRAAVDRFLSGHTHYWGGYEGWVRAFTPYCHNGTPDPSKLLRDVPRPDNVPRVKTNDALLPVA